MPGKRPGDTSRRVRIAIPERGHVVVVGRTVDGCDRLVKILKPRVEAKGGTLKVFSQLHQMEELAAERADVLVLDSGLGPTARETVVWMMKRSNANVQVVEFGK